MTDLCPWKPLLILDNRGKLGLRAQVITAVAGGLSCRAAAERFGVSAASAVRWVHVWRETGSPAAKRRVGDRRSERIEVHRAIILAAIDAKVDMTLVEIAEMLLREHGASFAPSTVWRFLDRHAMTLKKNRARSRAGQARRSTTIRNDAKGAAAAQPRRANR